MNRNEYSDIFEPFERLIEIEILNKKYLVPENNSLLRCFQFISLETISHGDFCWNADCANCQVWLKCGEKEKAVIACRTKIEPQMQITKLSAGIDLGENLKSEN